jgi:hypothetical protein
VEALEEPIPELTPEPSPEPAPPRFLSQEEEEEQEQAARLCETVYFSASTPSVATTVAYAPPAVKKVVAPIRQTAIEAPVGLAQPVQRAQPASEPASAPEPEPLPQEPMLEPAQPRFAEIAEEPIYTPIPRDYNAEYSGELQIPDAYDERRPPPETTLFSEPNEEELRELDKPAFMRRLHF